MTRLSVRGGRRSARTEKSMHIQRLFASRGCSARRVGSLSRSSRIGLDTAERLDGVSVKVRSCNGRRGR